jgi:hypothetical protein
MVSNWKKLDDGCNILSPWEKARRYCKCGRFVLPEDLEMLVRQKNEQLNVQRNKVVVFSNVSPCSLVGMYQRVD